MARATPPRTGKCFTESRHLPVLSCEEAFDLAKWLVFHRLSWTKTPEVCPEYQELAPEDGHSFQNQGRRPRGRRTEALEKLARRQGIASFGSLLEKLDTPNGKKPRPYERTEAEELQARVQASGRDRRQTTLKFDEAATQKAPRRYPAGLKPDGIRGFRGRQSHRRGDPGGESAVTSPPNRAWATPITSCGTTTAMPLAVDRGEKDGCQERRRLGKKQAQAVRRRPGKGAIRPAAQ